MSGDKSIPCTGTPRVAQRECDAPGADGELERPPVTGQAGEEVDGGPDDAGSNITAGSAS